jgi:hypothetical protein
LHAFEDADMAKGQGEWRIMVQIGCRACPPHQQDLFLEPAPAGFAKSVKRQIKPRLLGQGTEVRSNYTGSQGPEFKPRQEHNFIDIIEFDEYAKAGRPFS